MNDVELKQHVITNGKIDKAIKETVKKCVDTNCVNIVIEDGSKKGDNFSASVYRILYGRDSDAKVDYYSSLFLKLVPKESIYRDNQFLHNIFTREVFIYSKVLPFFKKFQQSKGIIPEVNGFYEYAKFYSDIDVKWCECVLLEDLKPFGFEMLNYKVDEITYDHVSLAMKAFGKFHAISFALRDQKPNHFGQVTSQLFDVYLDAFSDSFKVELINLLKESEDIFLLEKVNRASADGFFAMGKECVSTKNAERFAVICHGDAWINNMMYKNDNNDRVREVRLIDWQYSNYTTPAIDLVLYLMCSLNKELRDKHFEEFLHIYHGSLRKMLKRLGSDPSKLFSFEDLLEQLHRFGRFALLPCAILLKFLSPSAVDLNETAKKFRRKLRTNARDMIADMARLRYI